MPHQLTAPANEVFNAAEAAAVYAGYFEENGTVPEGYRLRPLQLDLVAE